ncbi:fimbrial protein [Providencia alcalifaciens]|uniref:fimbrial protein n=1 Tax=Providencia alcalifaciens TaxID=126385 RepID=UPI001CC7D978|nr:fimbrial protein [Providencia alcalifaciens]CAG9426782.1 Type-1 fimbrial protein, A chain [Providencia alcalifaciens]
MKFKTTLLLSSILAISFSSAVSAAPGSGNASGKIHFKGQFIDTTCTVEANNENKNEGTVQLGTWISGTFEKADETTEAVPFTIGLSNCPDVINKARVIFEGTPHADKPALYKVDSATGVGIGISASATNKNYYVPGTEVDGIDLTNNSGEKTYYARYVTTADKVTPGAANADVTVTIQYNQ